jgi:hypothetical protein
MKASQLLSAIGLGEEKLGLHDPSMRRSRPYIGQPWTDTGIRGSTEIKGITFRDLKDAYIRALIMSSDYAKVKNKVLIREAEKGESALLSPNDVYEIEGGLDFIAVSQNLACEIEKLMGIFPNTNIPGIPTSLEIMSELCDPNVKPGSVIIPGMTKSKAS